MNRGNHNNLIESKEIEYYSNCVNAWFNTKLERDKSILTISAGGLGLLITLLIAFGINNKIELIIFISAIFYFMVAIIVTIVVFNRNALYLEKLNKDEDSNDSSLLLLDRIGLFSFIFGIIFTFLIGCSLLVSSLNRNMEEEMKQENKQTRVVVKKSYNKAPSMRPQNQKQTSSIQNSHNQNNSQNNNNSSDNKKGK